MQCGLIPKLDGLSLSLSTNRVMNCCISSNRLVGLASKGCATARLQICATGSAASTIPSFLGLGGGRELATQWIGGYLAANAALLTCRKNIHRDTGRGKVVTSS